MSTTYHAVAVVGCRITKDSVFSDDYERVCEHPIPGIDSDVRRITFVGDKIGFCTECGKRLWRPGLISIPAYQGSVEHCDEATLAGFPVFFNDFSDHILVAGRHVKLDDNNQDWMDICHTNFADWERAQHAIQEKLEPLGLYDRNEFGLAVMMWY